MNVLLLPMCRQTGGGGAERARTLKLQATGGRREKAESSDGFTLAWVLLYSCGGVWRLAIGRILLFRLCRGSLRPKSPGRTTCRGSRYRRRRTGATLCRIHERQPRKITYRRRMVSVRRSRKNRLP